MIDPKYQPNPVVPKPKLPKATVINLNPNYQKPVDRSIDSKKIVVSIQKNDEIQAKEIIENIRSKNNASEKSNIAFDFKKILNSGIEQSKNIIQNTAGAFKNVENKIQTRFKNEIIRLEKSKNQNQKIKEEPIKKEKKKMFELPKSASKKSNVVSQDEIKTKKNLVAQLVILAVCFCAIFTSTTIILSFQSILGGFETDLKMLQWILMLFFLTNSVFSIYAKEHVQSKGAKGMFFEGLLLVMLGLLAAIISPNIITFVLSISVVFAFGFAYIFAVSKRLFFYNSGFCKIEKSNTVYYKLLVGIIILSTIISSILSFYFGWKTTISVGLALCVASIFNLNKISEISEKKAAKRTNPLNILLFIASNLLISFGIIESLYYGWFNAKNSIDILGTSINPRVSISIITTLLGLFLLAFSNFINNKSFFSVKKIIVGFINFTKSSFLGGLLSLFVFGIYFFILLAKISNLIQAMFAILPILFGLLIASFLTNGLSDRISRKNTQLLGLIVYIIGLIMAYFTLSTGVVLVNLFSPFFLIGLGAGLFQFVQNKELSGANFSIEYSKMFSVIIFGLAFFWSFSSSNFNLTTTNNLIPENLKPDLFGSIGTIKNLNVCKFIKPNQSTKEDYEANQIRQAICDNFAISVVEGSKTVITLAAVISMLCSFVVMSEKGDSSL